MHLKYRTLEHAVCKQGQYGYFQEAIYISPRNKTELRANTQTPQERSGDASVWPIKLKIVLTIHNHEDLEKFLDGAMDTLDTLRGEHGENEAVSPSALHPVFSGLQ